ncbi:ParB/RepB/Spo0J family partition protein [Priestia megaterium]|uniref:ParB/RepB/Spo0J family partition protein n=1 Tax=Priestia megaterium TaxID=1404 RepID=UPI001B3A22F9|nr:ParB/RepB/Spo0J family partition protein [Priestia megaterium]MBQ4868186.1 ParB/RepB/Spo0J family partition protein [Priestia megaterium]
MAKGLGKGINALFSGLDAQADDSIQEVAIHELRPNPYQPRKTFNKEAINELKQSILHHGILQPIVARKSIKGYEILAGERRFRAAKEADLDTVPVIIKDFSEKQMMELALLENLQREDLTPIEEATAYQLLMDKLDMTQEQLATRLGKSRPHIANYVRLLQLPEEIQTLISTNELSMGHGRTLVGLKNKALLPKVVEKIRKEQLNVRQLEAYIAHLNKAVPRETSKTKKDKDLFIKQSETQLRERFGTSVHITQSKKKGKIEIEFFSKEDLNRLLELFNDLSQTNKSSV